MSSKQTISAAEVIDRLRWLMFLAMLLMSAVYALETIMFLVDAQTASYLDMVALGISVSLIVIVLYIIYQKRAKLSRDDKHLSTSSDSYTMQILRRACVHSWAATFILQIILTRLTDDGATILPTEFYLKLTMFCMLAVFSISYFVLIRADEDEFADTGESL